jgi:hypothetical protein
MCEQCEKKKLASPKSLRAKKQLPYIVEPELKGFSKFWDGHHATNPCVIRFKEDSRVFLGYRAGGEEDYFRVGPWDSYSSHLGLVILDETGKQVQHRFQYPIMTILRDEPLPKNEKEYVDYLKAHPGKIVNLHDFRFFEWQDYLYVIFHEGPVNGCYDALVRMKVSDFLSRIKQCTGLLRLQLPSEEIIQDWKAIWWDDGVWEPCGYKGTNKLWSSPVIKGDIVYLPLADGTLELNHRPWGDGMSVLNVGKDLFVTPTKDGITKYGSFELNIRPGYLDNSHMGNNGMPVRAKIGNADVYIDVTHSCHNRMIADETCDKHDLYYYPYFRVKDAATGELLYYSEEPILDYDEVWKEYTNNGAWVKNNPILGGVMFAGGQLESQSGKNGLEDEFVTYLGLGDTAVGMASFTLKDLLPEQVITDIQSRSQHKQSPVTILESLEFQFPKKIQGWEWSLGNDTEKRTITVNRKLVNNETTETGARSIYSRPGYFDSDFLHFDGISIRLMEGIGWIVLYTGIHWEELHGEQQTQISAGFLILDDKNPEKILFRSTEPILQRQVLKKGWVMETHDFNPDTILERASEFIPEKVIREIKRLRFMEDKGLAFNSMMNNWLRQKSGIDKTPMNLPGFEVTD